MKINWKIRLKSKMFWMSLLSAVLLFLQSCLALFGVNFDTSEIGDSLTVIINALFTLLAVLGVVNDPTTVGLSDSSRALSYVSQARDSEEE